jgi:hypothetical protein
MFPLTAYVRSESREEPIHLLIEADLYGSLLLGDLPQSSLGKPIAQKIALGSYPVQ